jgi:hypothetical protein
MMTKTTPKISKFDTCCQAGFHILELSKLQNLLDYPRANHPILPQKQGWSAVPA